MRSRPTLVITLCLLAGSCKVGPDYKVPDAPRSAYFKELNGWKQSDPRDNIDKGAWWSIYHDAELDGLECMVEVSNQTVKQFEAQYRTTIALVGEARAGLFPSVGLTGAVTRVGTGASGSNRPSTSYGVTGSAFWAVDLWGRVRRQVESNVAGAQVSAADLANVKLSAQAVLATDYFNLRAADSLERLLRDTTAAYRRALQITENQ